MDHAIRRWYCQYLCVDCSTRRRGLKETSLVPPAASSLANPRASILCVHPFDPLSAKCGSRERIRKVLCLARNLVVPELHDAHGVVRLAVVCQDEFGDPKITAANDSSDSKPLLLG